MLFFASRVYVQIFTEYIFQNKRAILRTKDCRDDNPSPVDNNQHLNEDAYSVPCATTINPISVQTVLPIPTVNYDMTYHHNTTYAASASFAQPLYGTTATFPVQEIYPANPQNVVLQNGNPYFSPHQEFPTLNNHGIDVKRSWEVVSYSHNLLFGSLIGNNIKFVKLKYNNIYYYIIYYLYIRWYMFINSIKNC